MSNIKTTRTATITGIWFVSGAGSILAAETNYYLKELFLMW